MTTTVYTFTMTDLAEQGLAPGARVGSCHASGYGTVDVVATDNSILVRWDDGAWSWESWAGVCPLGYAAGED